MRPPIRRSLLFTGVLLLSSAAPVAGAQVQTVQERSAFLDALITKGSNSLDDFDVDDGALTSVSPLPFGTPAFTTGTLTANTFGAGLQPEDTGPNLVWVVSGGPTQLTFTSAVNGFGAQFVGLGSVRPVVFQLFFGATLVGQAGSPTVDSPDGYGGFFGLTAADAFDRVVIDADVQEFIAMDDLAAGVGLSAVPEPSTAALVGAGGLAVLLGARRRRTPNGPSSRREVAHA